MAMCELLERCLTASMGQARDEQRHLAVMTEGGLGKRKV